MISFHLFRPQARLKKISAQIGCIILLFLGLTSMASANFPLPPSQLQTAPIAIQEVNSLRQAERVCQTTQSLKNQFLSKYTSKLAPLKSSPQSDLTLVALAKNKLAAETNNTTQSTQQRTYLLCMGQLQQKLQLLKQQNNSETPPQSIGDF